MCHKAKQRKYTHLSMCSCCHAVSKYSSVVKAHLVQEHSHYPTKRGVKVVIPVRIDSRYERYMGLSLDKKRSLKDLKCLSHKTPYLAQKEKRISNEKKGNDPRAVHKRMLNEENSILCTVCKKELDVIKIKREDEETSDQETESVSVVYKCKFCNVSNEYVHAIGDIKQNVSETHTSGRQARKRTLPKWLQEYKEGETGQIKKRRKDFVSNKSFSKNVSPLKKVIQKSATNLTPKVVLKNFEHDLDGGSQRNRNKSVFKAPKDPGAIMQDSISSLSDQDNLGKNEDQRKEGSDLDHDYYIQKRVSREAGADLQGPHDKDKCSGTGNCMELSLETKALNENMECNSDGDYNLVKESKASESESFKCPHCENKYPWLKSLNRHIRLKHPDCEPIKSKDINKRKSIPEQNKSSVVKEHFEGVYSTDQNEGSVKDIPMVEKIKAEDTDNLTGGPGDDSNQENNVSSNFKIITSPEQQMFKCPYCEHKEYPLLKTLNRHIRRKHPDCETLKSEGRKGKYSPDQYNSSVKGKTIEEKVMIEDFDEDIEGDSDDDYRPEEESGSELEGKKAARLEMLKCEYCDKEYTQKKTLNKHKKLKHPDVIIVKTKPVNKHKTKEINNELCFRYKCPFCPFYLHHREYVFSHIEKGHPEVLHFTLHDLVKQPVAMKKNEIDRECFQCPYCNITCKWKADLVFHCRYHHPDEGLPTNIPCVLPDTWVDNHSVSSNMLCPICQTVNEGKENLIKHLREHMSGKSFNISFHSSLPEPEKLGKQPFRKLLSYLCPYCDSVFRRKESYHYHLDTHSGGAKERSVSTAIKCLVISQESNMLVGKDTSSESEQLPQSYEGNKNVAKKTAEKTNETESTQEKDVESQTETEVRSKVNPDVSMEHDSTLENNQEVVDTKVTVSHTHSKLVAGSYICPVCDNFKTLSKELAVKHMKDNHRNKISEIEILYILPFIFLEGNGVDITNTKMSFGCKCCHFTTDVITDAVKHVKIHSNDIENDSADIRQENILEEGSVEPNLNPLFKLVSLPSMEYGNAEELYNCWSCDPSYLFRSRKGYRKHMLTYHEDAVGCDVGEVMNQMLGLLEEDKTVNYVCTVCGETVQIEGDLRDHFKATHPDEVNELLDQLNRRQIMNKRQTLTDENVCMICNKGFSDGSGFTRHLLLHLNKPRIHCFVCGIHFDTKHEVAAHSAAVHSVSTEMCSICGKLFGSHKGFLRHMRAHRQSTNIDKNDRMLCQHCGTEIGRKCFKRHLLRYHSNIVTCDCDICTSQKAPSGVTPVMCNLCNRVFCTHFFLSAHRKRDHDKQTLHGVRGNGRDEFKCVGCAQMFESQKGLQSHSHVCQKSLDTVGQSSHISKLDGKEAEMSDSGNKKNEKLVISADVSSGFIKENFLEYKMGSSLPYMCRICQKSFRVPKYMYNHVRRKHASDESKRFRCKVCKMAFYSSNSLKVHCKQHIGLRPHQCKYCKKSYKTVSHLKDHLRIHTDAATPQFSCGYCGNKFLQSGRLMAHVIHHDKLRPYKCPFCSRGFTTSGDLKRHMDKYDKSIKKNELKCSFCKETFPNFHYLSKHFQTHTVPDPFHCIVCEKKFSSFRQMYFHKVKNKHFTESERKAAREDLQAPGRLFRGVLNRKMKAKQVPTVNETDLAVSVVENVQTENDEQSQKSVFEDGTSVEIEIPKRDIQDKSAKDALSGFHENVIQSMIDLVEEGDNSSMEDTEQFVYSYNQVNQSEYVVDDISTQPGVSFATVDGSEKVKTTDTQNEITVRETGTDIDDLAYMVAQNVQSQEMGKTQTYQTPDGSLIHVCVIKPLK